MPHPKPWEFELQVWIHDLKPPLEPGTVVFLGWDEVGLAALAVWQHVSGGNFYFEAVAVANRLRGGDGSHAREAVDVALSIMEGTAAHYGDSELAVVARVHQRNGASQRLLSRAGFAPDADRGPDEHGYAEWFLVRDLRGL